MSLKSSLVPGALTIAMISACADPPPRGEPPGSDPGPIRYEANATVLESADHSPELCLGAIALSLPPQCGIVPVIGWDWETVEGEEFASGTTWGSFHVVGTYDGTSFTLLAAGPAEPSDPSERDPIDTPCSEPEGGWVALDPDRATDADMNATVRVVRDESDFAGVWIDDMEDPVDEGPTPPGGIILNVAFTGDLDRHTDEIEQLWGGPLCVVQHEYAYLELSRIQRELSSDVAAELGVQVLGSGIDQSENEVVAEVVVADEPARLAIEARYGPSAVLLKPALTPVEG